MEAFLERMARFDRHRLALAPLLGLLAGFLANRAFGGDTGWALLAQMGAGAALVTLGACVAANLSRMFEEQALEEQLAAQQMRQEAGVRHVALVHAEAERFRLERHFREQVLAATRRAEALERRLFDAAPSVPQAVPVELITRLAALEAAQQRMYAEQVEISRRVSLEAEQLKASLLQLAITESQRQRNVAAPESDQSGRIIELESRIHRLAREIEALSSRQPATQSAGTRAEASAPDKARLGFLQAMLDANMTLRKSAA